MSLAVAIPEIFQGCKILKCVTWPWPRPFQGCLDSRLGLATVNLQTKFEVSNYTHYEYKYVYSPKKAENNKQIDIQNRWTDCVNRQNDKLIKYNTTKHSIKTDKNPQPNMQTFDKIKLDKMVMITIVWSTDR